MSVSSVETVERSDPFIHDLIADRPETGWKGLTTADAMARLAIPELWDGPAAQLVVIAGGAAGGKSTLAEDMAGRLAGDGAAVAIVGSDDFVRFDRGERHRREQDGMPPEEKYDFSALRRTIGAICANRTPGLSIEVPQYDPPSGLAIDGSRRRWIPPVDVLIVEGDMLGEQGQRPQDLYPDQAVSPQTLYVHVPDEVRLARRVERDMRKRNAAGETADDIVASFLHRQASQHLPYTLPYAEAADAILLPATVTPPQMGPKTDLHADHRHPEALTYNVYPM